MQTVWFYADNFEEDYHVDQILSSRNEAVNNTVWFQTYREFQDAKWEIRYCFKPTHLKQQKAQRIVSDSADFDTRVLLYF